MARKKELGLDGQGIQKTMRLKNYLGDGMGTVALNGMSGLVGMLTYFYTDKVGIAAAAAGTIMIIAKIFDAFTDLAMGQIVERTRSRFGKARPWIIRMAIPAFIVVVALFCVPAQATAGVKFAYGLFSNTLATAIVYTAIAIPYNCLMAYVTRSTEERGKMGIFRAFLGYIMGMIVAIGLIPLTNALGGDQAAWIKLGVILGIVIAVSLVLTFVANKERFSTQTDADGNVVEEEKVPFFAGIKYMFSNKYWVIMLFVMVSINVLFALSGATSVYYAKWILQDENIVALLGAVGLIPVAVGFAITGPMIKKFGLAKTARIALLVGVVGTVVRVIFPYQLWAALVFGPLVSFGSIPLMAVGGVLVNNTVEYGEWKHGKRLVGMANSATGFGSKVGSGLGGALIGWVLALGGYDATLTAQAPAALNSILAISIWIPGIVLLLVYILLRFYDLDAKAIPHRAGFRGTRLVQTARTA